MNVFDKFIMGDTAGINWCFENRHFQERLDDNGIERSYVIDCLMNEEPISWEHVEKNIYAAVYNEKYRKKEIKSYIKKKMVKKTKFSIHF